MNDWRELGFEAALAILAIVVAIPVLAILLVFILLVSLLPVAIIVAFVFSVIWAGAYALQLVGVI